jgi:hypothetical protein
LKSLIFSLRSSSTFSHPTASDEAPEKSRFR